MSRIGKKPILIPENVEVKIKDAEAIIKGPKGEISQNILPQIRVETKEGRIFISQKKDDKNAKAFWGLTRALIANAVKGVTEGFEKKLEIEGIGLKASVEGENLILQMGFSHPVRVKTPEGIKFSVEKNIITISGINKEEVNQIAAKIRKVKPPEPYKGKGIRYQGEHVRRKLGKRAISTS